MKYPPNEIVELPHKIYWKYLVGYRTVGDTLKIPIYTHEPFICSNCDKFYTCAKIDTKYFTGNSVPHDCNEFELKEKSVLRIEEAIKRNSKEGL